MRSQERFRVASGRDTELELLNLILKDIISRVEETKLSVDQEIGNYPTPIPRCDEQFNHLLELRTRLSQLLSRLSAPAGQSPVLSDYVELITAFFRELTA